MWIYHHALFHRDKPELLDGLKRKTSGNSTRRQQERMSMGGLADPSMHGRHHPAAGRLGMHHDDGAYGPGHGMGYGHYEGASEAGRDPFGPARAAMRWHGRAPEYGVAGAPHRRLQGGERAYPGGSYSDEDASTSPSASDEGSESEALWGKRRGDGLPMHGGKRFAYNGHSAMRISPGLSPKRKHRPFEPDTEQATSSEDEDSDVGTKRGQRSGSAEFWRVTLQADLSRSRGMRPALDGQPAYREKLLAALPADSASTRSLLDFLLGTSAEAPEDAGGAPALFDCVASFLSEAAQSKLCADMLAYQKALDPSVSATQPRRPVKARAEDGGNLTAEQWDLMREFLRFAVSQLESAHVLCKDDHLRSALDSALQVWLHRARQFV